MAIRFGTDGWRGIIADDYTFANLSICAQGTANYLKKTGQSSRGIIVGYDTRFGSESFANTAARIFVANGIPTLLCDRSASTPAISYNLVSHDAAAGCIITASHNPPEWNGFKYKPDYGGSASVDIITELEKQISEVSELHENSKLPLDYASSSGLLEYVNPVPSYLSHIASQIDIKAIRDAGLTIIVDSMFGSAAGYFKGLLEGGSTTILEINDQENPSFPGMIQPEPIEPNLRNLITKVTDNQVDIGLATDGDGDRLGVVDNKGDFISTITVFALLCFYQLEILGRTGPLVKSITMTSMIDRLGEEYDVPVFTTPVGFKYLGPTMIRENALAAGEESGGYAFRGSIPERDGILSGMLILDLMVKTGKSLSQLIHSLRTKTGPYYFNRCDLSFDSYQRQSISERVQISNPTSLAGRLVTGRDTSDGLKFLLDGGYWLLIRFSGTEPLLRIYAEGSSPTEALELLQAGKCISGL